MVWLTTTKSFKRCFGVVEFLVCANEEFMEKIHLARFQMFKGYYDKKASGEFTGFAMESLAIQRFCKWIILTTFPIMNFLQGFVLKVVFPQKKFFGFPFCYQILCLILQSYLLLSDLVLIYMVNCLSMWFNLYRVRFITNFNNFIDQITQGLSFSQRNHSKQISEFSSLNQ